ncbi:MAG: hypothetical protein ACI4JN_10705 [Ruminococcus sp.]
MNIYFLSLPGSDIPDSLSFKIAFVIVTAVYVISMIILFMLYKKSVRNIPAPKDDKKDCAEDEKEKEIRNR